MLIDDIYLPKAKRENLTNLQRYYVDCFLQFWMAATPELCRLKSGEKANVHQITDAMNKYRLASISLEEEFSVEVRNRATLLFTGCSLIGYDIIGPEYDAPVDDFFHHAPDVAFGWLSQIADAANNSESVR